MQRRSLDRVVRCMYLIITCEFCHQNGAPRGENRRQRKTAEEQPPEIKRNLTARPSSRKKACFFSCLSPALSSAHPQARFRSPQHPQERLAWANTHPFRTESNARCNLYRKRKCCYRVVVVVVVVVETSKCERAKEVPFVHECADRRPGAGHEKKCRRADTTRYFFLCTAAAAGGWDGRESISVKTNFSSSLRAARHFQPETRRWRASESGLSWGGLGCALAHGNPDGARAGTSKPVFSVCRETSAKNYCRATKSKSSRNTETEETIQKRTAERSSSAPAAAPAAAPAS